MTHQTPPSRTIFFHKPISKITFQSKPFNHFPQIPKITKMPLPLTTKPTTKTHIFTSQNTLYNFLQTRIKPDSFATWGTRPGTKNVHNLWQEIVSGETMLSDSFPPLRSVEVVVVKVRDGKGRVLIESCQELSNGDVRVRSRPLSEKMKAGETVRVAVIRAVKEELGKGEECVRIDEESYRRRVEQRGSVSYPGLDACYVLHSVDVFVEGLPDGEEFSTEEDEGNENGSLGGDEKAVTCKKHYWKWVDEDSVSSS